MARDTGRDVSASRGRVCGDIRVRYSEKFKITNSALPGPRGATARTPGWELESSPELKRHEWTLGPRTRIRLIQFTGIAPERRSGRRKSRLPILTPDPMAPTLKRIARERQATPGLARKQAGERHIQPRFVGPGDRLHEAAA